MNEVNSAKAVLISASGAAGVVFTKIFGSLNDDLLSLILLMIIDFITAFILAALFRKSTKTINGGLSSRACMQGRNPCAVMTRRLCAVAFLLQPR